MGTFTIRPAEQQDVIDALNDTNIKNTINALAPYSGYTQVSKKLDNFVFQTSSSFLNKVADKNRFVKFGDKVVDTHLHTSYDATKGGVVADFTNTVPDVAEVITNGSNTTSVAVSAGDYVVDGSEKVVNGTFDTDTSGWTVGGYGGTITVIDGSLIISNTSGQNYGETQQTISTLTVGVKYILKIDRVSGTGTTLIQVGNNSSGTAYINAVGIYGKKTYEFTATESFLKIAILTYSNDGTVKTSYVDNISVKRVSNTFRAKQDAPIGTALTNTTYFEDRTQIGITNQALAYHAYNTLTNAYEGIKTEVLFSDVSKEDLLDNSVWMARNGFSKVSQFLYSKGSYLCLPVGIWQSLNKGAYHPVFNAFGSRLTGRNGVLTTSDFWYSSTATPITSVAGTFLYYTTGGDIDASGRPDIKQYRYVYPDQFIDVREYAKILNRDEVNLIIADKEENGVEEVVSIYTKQSATINYSYGTANKDKLTTDSSSFSVGEQLIVYSNGIYYPAYVNSITSQYNWDIQLLTDTSSDYLITGASIVIYSTKKKPILSSNTKLLQKAISNPTYYSQVMKDRLASGAGIVGLLPDLADDTGVSNLPNGSKTVFKLNGKFTTTHQILKSTDSGVTWSLLSLTTHYTVNTTTNSITFVTAPADTDMILIADTDKCLPYIQTTPKPVISVEPKVIASNSHSIYKGALIGNQVSGKIQVGNGANGYESKVLENALLDNYDFSIGTGSSITSTTTTKMLLLEDTAGYKSGDIVSYILNNLTAWTYNSVSIVQPNWVVVGVQTKPTHSTIALDNANSSASKYFKVLEQGNNGVLAGLNGKELAYNTTTSSYDGDNELFDKLTNSTKTDLNGKTVRCFHGVIPINGDVK